MVNTNTKREREAGLDWKSGQIQIQRERETGLDWKSGLVVLTKGESSAVTVDECRHRERALDSALYVGVVSYIILYLFCSYM